MLGEHTAGGFGLRGWRSASESGLNLVHDSLEGFGIVQGEVGEDLAVDFDTCLVDEAHQFRITEVVLTGGGVDTLNPEGAEVAFLVLAVTVGVGETFFPGILGNGPHVTAAAKVAAGEFQDFFTACAGGNVVY